MRVQTKHLKNMLSKELLEEFKQLYQEEFGISLTNEEAIIKATGLLDVFKILIQPIDLIKKEMPL